MPVGKGSILRAANASAVNYEAAPDSETRTESPSRPLQKSVFAEIPVQDIMDVPALWLNSIDVIPDVTLLSDSITKYGLLEPLLVGRTGESSYQILSGRKRLLAARLLNLLMVPSRILTLEKDSDAEMLFRELQSFENNTVRKHPQTNSSKKMPSYLL